LKSDAGVISDVMVNQSYDELKQYTDDRADQKLGHTETHCKAENLSGNYFFQQVTSLKRTYFMRSDSDE